MTTASRGVSLALVLGSLIASSRSVARAIQEQAEIEEAACVLLAVTPPESTHAIRLALYREFLVSGDMLEAIKRTTRAVTAGELP